MNERKSSSIRDRPLPLARLLREEQAGCPGRSSKGKRGPLGVGFYLVISKMIQTIASTDIAITATPPIMHGFHDRAIATRSMSL